MRKIHLSTPLERTMVIGLLAALAAIFAILLYALRHSGTALLAAALASLFLLMLFGTYVYSVCTAACLVDAGHKKLKILGLRAFERDVSAAVRVRTGEFEMGSTVTRRIMLLNENDELVTAFATSFLSKRGAFAEPAAMQLAQELGIEFVPSLEPWEYDSKAKWEHDAQERSAQKARRKGNKNPRTEADAAPAPARDEEEWINYDALDDEK